MNSDTPETDANKRSIEGFADEWVPRYVSEEIERSRNAALSRLAVVSNALLKAIGELSKHEDDLHHVTPLSVMAEIYEARTKIKS